MLGIFEIPKQAQEIIRYNGNVFYEYNGVIYKKSIINLNENYQIVSQLEGINLK